MQRLATSSALRQVRVSPQSLRYLPIAVPTHPRYPQHLFCGKVLHISDHLISELVKLREEVWLQF